MKSFLSQLLSLYAIWIALFLPLPEIFTYEDLHGFPIQLKTKNVYEKRAYELLQEIRVNPSSYHAFLSVIEILRMKEELPAEVLNDIVEKISTIKNIHPQAKIVIMNYTAFHKTYLKNFEEMEKAVIDRGIITDWLVIGPFDNQDLSSIDKEIGPEMDIGMPFQLGKPYTGDERSVYWKEARSDPLTGTLFLDRFLYPNDRVCGFAGTYLHIKKTSTIRIWMVSSGAVSMWVDGFKAIYDPFFRDFGPPRHAVDVTLKKGVHQLLFKVCIDAGSWKLFVQTVLPSGNAVVLEHGSTTRLHSMYHYKTSSPVIKEVNTVLKHLQQTVKNEKDYKSAGDYAKYLLLTHSDDRKQKKAQDLAKKAAEKSSKCSDYITLAEATNDENKAVWALRKCLSLEPGNSFASRLLMLHYMNSMEPEDFLSLIRKEYLKFSNNPFYCIMIAEALNSVGFSLLAFKELEKCREDLGDVPVIIEKLTNFAAISAPHKTYEKLLKELFNIKKDDPRVRLEYIQNLIKKGLKQEALNEIQTLLRYFWIDTRVISSAVETLIGMNKIDEAQRVLIDETKRNGDYPEAWKNLGSLYNLKGDKKLTLICYKKVLELNPQNVEVRKYISNLEPEENFEKDYIKGDDYIRELNASLLEQHGRESLWDPKNIEITILVDQEIDRVYENGMSCRFVQKTIRINTSPGIKQEKYQTIFYSPSRQELKILRAAVLHEDGTIEDAIYRFTIPVVEEEFRLYYDDAYEIIEMPSLQVGDIIDIQYKLSDSEERNIWEKHFGAIIPVMSIYPKVFFRFNVIADKAFNLYLNWTEDSNVPLSYNKLEGKNLITHTWEARNLPPLISEPDMPPIVELSPLIRVTSFATWEEFGKWWWGIANPQMIVDKNIKQKVAQLIEGKKTEDEKIAAIFDWVIRSTRYVGLEFGIHGFKPYKTTEVMSRGFGDCKDKATLLYVMLKEAGIDAAVALLRTRSSGIIDSSFPFQFYFDHAITAVPSKGLFLDGTVNYLDYKTLPPADQGVFALIISENKIEKVITPVVSPETNSQITDITMQITSSGEGKLSGKIQTKGMFASTYRSRYQSEATRKERLEDELSGIFPGINLLTFSFSGLENYADDVNLSFSAEAPSVAMVSQDEIQFTALPSYNLYKRYASRSQRKFNVVLKNQGITKDRYLYLAPPGTVFGKIPDSFSIGNAKEGYTFELNSRLIDPRTLEINSSLQLTAFSIPPEKYKEFRNFCRDVDHAVSQRIHILKLSP